MNNTVDQRVPAAGDRQRSSSWESGRRHEPPKSIGVRLLAGLIALVVLPVLFPAGVRAETSVGDSPADIERALLAATFTCLQQSGQVPVGITQMQAVGDVAADGTAIAPTVSITDSSDCAAQAGRDMAELLIENLDRSVGLDVLVTEFATSPHAGSASQVDTRTATDGADLLASALAAKAGPKKAQGWINGMNRKQDMSGSFFIADYGDPGWFNWKSDECSVPYLPKGGNGPFNFEWPCRRHDFGYRNLKRGESRYPGHNMWNKKNKAVADRQFRDDLYLHCNLHFPGKRHAACIALAVTYHYAVSTSKKAGPNTWGMERDTLYPF